MLLRHVVHTVMVALHHPDTMDHGNSGGMGTRHQSVTQTTTQACVASPGARDVTVTMLPDEAAPLAPRWPLFQRTLLHNQPCTASNVRSSVRQVREAASASYAVALHMGMGHATRDHAQPVHETCPMSTGRASRS